METSNDIIIMNTIKFKRPYFLRMLPSIYNAGNIKFTYGSVILSYVE